MIQFINATDIVTNIIIFLQNVTLTSILEDKELREFFTDLVSTYLHNESDLARIDILNCPVETNADGKQLIQTISKLIGVPVYTSKVSAGKEKEKLQGETAHR